MEMFGTIFWDASMHWVQAYASYDLQAQRYYLRGVINQEEPFVFDQPGSKGISGYTPAALRRMGRR